MDKDRNIEQMEVTNKLLLDMVQNQRNNNNNMFKTFIITLICYTLILISMIIGFFVYESQFEITDSITESTTQTIEQEVSGDGSEINNVEGDMYKDNAVHNE